MLRITAHLELPEIGELLARYGLNKGGRVQQAVNEAVISYCKEGHYVPASPNRTLEDSVVSDLEQGLVVWDTPYAHYQYMGEVYGPNIPRYKEGVLVGWYSPPKKKKHPTGRKLTYDTAQNPNAGKYWFERMKADHARDIIASASAAMRGGGNHR